MMITAKVFGLDRSPLQSKFAAPYIWADYIELLCLFNLDRQISRADIAHIMTKSKDTGYLLEESSDLFLNEEINASLLPDEYSSSDIDMEFFLSGPKIESVSEEEPSPILNDREEEIIGNWFSHLEYRMNSLGEMYPFRVDRGVIKGVDDSRLTDRHKLYLFFLFASSLKYISNDSVFTSLFEIVSLVAMKKFLPPNGKVRFVGKNPRNKSIYNTTIWRKIQLLASDTHEEIAASCRNAQTKLTDTGDRGLDVVGIVLFNDNSRGNLLLFGQCGCGKDWEMKQLEAHVINWQKFLEFHAPPNNVIFIPYIYRGADGNWYNYMDLREGILVDRIRLIGLSSTKIRLLQRLTSYDDLVDAILKNSSRSY